MDEIVRERIIRIDVLAFVYGVRCEKGGYFGVWRCLACEDSSGHALPRNTEEQALIGAEANLRIHHALVHLAQREARRLATGFRLSAPSDT